MKAILVLTSTNPFYEEELKSLCEACHIEVVDVVIQKLEKINPATYIGKGKIEEIKLKLQDEMVIFDDELTPLQVKNLTDLLETEVTDRTDLILRIFDERAKTKEAKLQVEIARDQYLLPRLVGMQEHMSHQQGGSGFRGSGEKQIELDRRIIARKLARSRKELAEIVKQRQVQRQRRKNNQIPVIALVGYTNSGKSTLLNALKETLPEDMAVMVAQQADELTTKHHPDMIFLHSLSESAESAVKYDLEQLSIASLTMDVDFFIIGEVKGTEAMYLINAAYTGQISAATVHSLSAQAAPEKIVDYALQAAGNKYNRAELLKMIADCYHTVINVKDYKVYEVLEINGWDEGTQSIKYKSLYHL